LQLLLFGERGATEPLAFTDRLLIAPPPVEAGAPDVTAATRRVAEGPGVATCRGVAPVVAGAADVAAAASTGTETGRSTATGRGVAGTGTATDLTRRRLSAPERDNLLCP